MAVATDPSTAPIRILFGGQIISGSRKVLDEFGVWISFDTFTGWWDLPSVTGNFVQHQYSDDGYVTDSRFAGRVITLKGTIHGPDRVTTRQAIDRFKAALSTAKNTDVPLVVVEDELVRHAMVKLDHDPHISWDPTKSVNPKFDLQFIAAKSRIVWGDGSGYENTVPVNLTSSGPAAQVALLNEGEGAAPKCQLTLDGFDTPTLTHVESGKSITINLTQAAGQQTIIDFDSRAVTDAAGNSIRGSVSGRLFKLQPGTNTFQITAKTYAASSVMTARYSSTNN